jgi:RNA-directed DNA polymerase
VEHVLYVGGNWSNGSNAGLLYFNANNTSSNSNSNISARLLSNSIIIAQAFPHPLVKIMPRGRELVGYSNTLAGNKDVITIPKRVGFLYEKMLDRAFITETIRLAANGKKKRRSVRRVLANIDAYAEKLLIMLRTDSFIPSKPKVKRVYDVSSRKWREIKVVPFYPDGCVHWLCVRAMQPVLMRGMHHWSCASIPGRGGARAMRQIKRMVQRRPKDSKYCAQMDVRKFYDSIPLDGMQRALERKIKDKRFVRLVTRIIADGLAIGYYICQWLANYYLETLDRTLCACKGVVCEVRYMDNVTIFGRSKRALHKAVKAAEQHLQTLGLTLKGDWQVYPIKKRKVDAVGYKFGRNAVVLRKRSLLRTLRQFRRAAKRERVSAKMAHALLSRLGRLKWCASKTIMVKYVRPVGVQNLKGVVRIESARRCQTT